MYEADMGLILLGGKERYDFKFWLAVIGAKG